MAKTVPKSLQPVYALVGADPLLQVDALAEILALAPADAQRIDVDGETAGLSDVLDELRSFAMFGGSKIVVVRAADELVSRFRPQMEEYVTAPSNSATLILRFGTLPAAHRITKAIAKSGQIIDCKPPRDLPAWIITRARDEHQLAVAPDAARLLANLLTDLGRIDNELGKLALACPGGKASVDDVGQLVAFGRERQMWDLTNALGQGDVPEALQRWRQMVQGDKSAEFRAITWLGLWLENVRRALAMLADNADPFTIGQTLKIWPREAQRPFIETVQSMGFDGMRRAVQLLAQIDHQTKTGVGDTAENVERFILTLAAENGAGAGR